MEGDRPKKGPVFLLESHRITAVISGDEGE